MAVPNTAEENDFIRNRISSNSWLGITDKSSENRFTDNFYHNKKIEWDNWDSGQPDNGNWLLGGIII